jgi:hypothetical protein
MKGSKICGNSTQMEDDRNIPVYMEDNVKICYREKLFQTLGLFDLRHNTVRCYYSSQKYAHFLKILLNVRRFNSLTHEVYVMLFLSSRPLSSFAST